MLEVRRDNWWARCWRDEPLPEVDLTGDDVVRLYDVPTNSEPRRPASSFGIERWQHLGGMATYAMLGFDFEPAAIGQLVVQTREIENPEWRELAAAALSSVKWALADELGPGRLTLTHFKHDEVDTSVFLDRNCGMRRRVRCDSSSGRNRTRSRSAVASAVPVRRGRAERLPTS